MNKFSWAITATEFNLNKKDRSKSFLLEIEEAEDKLSEATMLMKQARHGRNLYKDDIDLILKEISSAQDGIRRIRNLLKGKF